MLWDGERYPRQARLLEKEEEEEDGEVRVLNIPLEDTQALDGEVPALVWVLEGQGLRILQALHG